MSLLSIITNQIYQEKVYYDCIFENSKYFSIELAFEES